MTVSSTNEICLQLLIARQALGFAGIQDYSAWAELLLAEGCTLENVAILASLSVSNDTDLAEAERYFSLCIHDLGWVLPNQSVAIFEYAQELAKAIADKTLKPSTGLALLKRFSRVTDDNEPLYSIWYELADDIDSLKYEERYLLNTELYHQDVHEFIVKVAKQFLALCQCKLPKNFFNLSVCLDCGHIGLALDKRIELVWLVAPLFRLFYGRNPTMLSVCSHCGSATIKSMRDYQGREIYLTSKQVIPDE